MSDIETWNNEPENENKDTDNVEGWGMNDNNDNNEEEGWGNNDDEGWGTDGAQAQNYTMDSLNTEQTYKEKIKEVPEEFNIFKKLGIEFVRDESKVSYANFPSGWNGI